MIVDAELETMQFERGDDLWRHDGMPRFWQGHVSTSPSSNFAVVTFHIRIALEQKLIM